jgi:hypothetical protein
LHVPNWAAAGILERADRPHVQPSLCRERIRRGCSAVVAEVAIIRIIDSAAQEMKKGVLGSD